MKALTVDESQLDALSTLYRRVAVIADALGSEATDSGHVIPTTVRTLLGARRAHFPRGYRFVALTRSAFDAAFGSRDGVATLLHELDSLELELGLVGDPERFHPDDHSRGVFWICLFAQSEERFGRNVLIRFLRVET